MSLPPLSKIGILTLLVERDLNPRLKLSQDTRLRV